MASGLPKHTVLQIALETAEKTVRASSEMGGALPLDRRVKELIDEQLRYVPLTRPFLEGSASGTSKDSVGQRKKARTKRRP